MGMVVCFWVSVFLFLLLMCFAHLGGLKVCCNFASPIWPNWDMSWLHRPTLIYCEVDGAYMPLASAQVDRISASEYIRSKTPPLV